MHVRWIAPLAAALLLALSPAAEARKPVIAYVGADDKLKLYDVEAGADLAPPDITIPGPVRRFSMSLNGRFIVWADAEKKIHLLDRQTGGEIPLPGIDVHPTPTGLTVSNAGRIAFDNNANGPAVVYESAAGAFIETGLDPNNGHRQSHLSGDGRYLATTCVTGAGKCEANEPGASDADAFVQNLQTKQDTGFPDNLAGDDRSEEHPCIDEDGSLVGIDIAPVMQRDIFLRDRGANANVSLPGFNVNDQDDINCVLDAAGDYVGKEDNNGVFKLYERASSTFVTLPPNKILTPAWFTAPYTPPPDGTAPDLRPCINRQNGTRRSDQLLGGPLGDNIFGGKGNDVINGGLGHDCLFGQSGNDTLSGESGNDRLGGGTGRDRLKGGKGNDRLAGDSGNDRLKGGDGDDNLKGGSGNDSLNGDKGRNKIDAGSGSDSVNSRNGVKETVRCGKGRDVVKADRNDRLRSCERRR